MNQRTITIIRHLVTAAVSAILTAAILLTIQNFQSYSPNDSASSSEPTEVVIQNSAPVSQVDSSESASETEQPVSSAVDNSILPEASEYDELSNQVQNFLTEYYNIDTKDNQVNYALEHFERYKVYLTDDCKKEYQPKEVTSELNYSTQTSYSSQLSNSKIYLDEIQDGQAKALAFIQVTTCVGDASPTTGTALVNLKLKQQGDTWLIDDILLNRQINFELSTEDLF